MGRKEVLLTLNLCLQGLSSSLLMYFACSLQSVVQWSDCAAAFSQRASE